MSVTESVLEDGGGRARRLGYLFLSLESARPLAGSARWALHNVDEVELGRGSVREFRRETREGAHRAVVSVPDPRLSSRHARITRLGGRWYLEDRGSKNGTRVNGAPIDRQPLTNGDVVETGGTFWVCREAEREARDADSATLEPPAPGLGSLLPSLEHEVSRLDAVASASVPVLLLGESGTGKELAARAVHSLSGRRGDFVAVNCGALPENLVESQLFGHKKGAFSGASEERAGYVKSAHRGTLLLDEVGDLPLGSQAALLRVLQEQEVVPVGATQPVRVDVRVVAATHMNLDAMVEEGRFRADLLARLRGFSFRLPPLSERRAELGHLLGRLGWQREAALSLEAARAVMRHDWPLNIRELKQAFDAALPLAGAGPVELEHLPEPLRATVRARPPREPSSQDRELADQLRALLREHEGNVSAVARALGKDRKQIRRWIQRFGLGG